MGEKIFTLLFFVALNSFLSLIKLTMWDDSSYLGNYRWFKSQLLRNIAKEHTIL